MELEPIKDREPGMHAENDTSSGSSSLSTSEKERKIE